MKKVVFALFSIILLSIVPVRGAHAQEYVVVLDPGHGGDSLGGNTSEFVEKYIDMDTARYIKERLEMYEGVTVYLTRDDADAENTTLKERAAKAEELNADFLFSIHYNMSENHTLFGTEIWTSAFGSAYEKGQEFAHIAQDDLTALGLFDRGVKTKISLKEKDQDYYGVIREAAERNIPCVIIEHCHLDEERDIEFLHSNNNPYKLFGYTDADAIAKYLRLQSTTLGVDYSDYERKTFTYPGNPVWQDRTSPTTPILELIDADTANNIAHVRVSSTDDDGYVQYYEILDDKGVNVQNKLFAWSNDIEAQKSCGNDSIEIDVPLIPDKEQAIRIVTYNQYEGCSDASELLILPAGISPVEETNPETDAEEVTYKEIVLENSEDSGITLSGTEFVIIAISILLVIILITIITLIVSDGRRRKRRRRKRR